MGDPRNKAKNAARAKRYDLERGRKRVPANPQTMIPGVEDTRARWAEFDACFTPRAVARQPIAWVAERFPQLVGGTFLDPCAGAGVWCDVAREVLRPSVLVAVEPRAEEAGHLQRHATHVCMSTIEGFAASCSITPREGEASRSPVGLFDCIATNPPWWCWPSVFRACWPLLAPGGVLVLHGPSAWGHSDEDAEGVDVFDECAPLYQLRTRGRVAYNGGSATDNRKVSSWVWVASMFPAGFAPTGGGAAWTTWNLPALGVEERRWRVRPGTEEQHGAV